MNPIFIFILCTVLAFTDTNAALNPVHQKIAGGAALLVTVAGGTIIYLLKSTTTVAQHVKELETENKILKEAAQDFIKASDEAVEAAYQIGLMFGRQSETMPPDTLLGIAQQSNTATPQDLVIKRDQEKEKLHMVINTTKPDLSKTSHDLK